MNCFFFVSLPIYVVFIRNNFGNMKPLLNIFQSIEVIIRVLWFSTGLAGNMYFDVPCNLTPFITSAFISFVLAIANAPANKTF